MLDPSVFILWQKVGYINLLSSSYRGIITNHIEIGIDHSVELKRKRSLLNTLRSYFGKQKLYQSLILPQLTLAEFDILEIYSLLKFYHRKGFGEKFEIKATNERRGVTFFRKLGSQRKLYYGTCFSWRYYGLAFLLTFTTMWSVFTLMVHDGNYTKSAMFAFVLSLIIIIYLEQDSKIGRLSANKLKPLAIDFDRDGIYQLNKTKFKDQVLWKDITAIEIVPKRKGTQLKPCLTIKLRSPQNQEFQIRNELLGTSIYELNEVMTNYWLDKGKQ